MKLRTAQISRGFKDISLAFRKHPVTNDLIILQNEDAIKVSVINLVRTRIGERFYNDLIGTQIEESLFEQQCPELAYTIQSRIENLLENFEPRIRLSEAAVVFPIDSNEMNVSIRYAIVGQQYPVQQVDFILQPTRI